MKATRDTTVGEVWDYLKLHKYDGCSCPVCFNFVFFRKLSYNSGMALTLIAAYKALKNDKCDDQGWLHLEHYLADQPDFKRYIKGVHGKNKYWGLLEQKPNLDDPSKNKIGYWRITPSGEAFVENAWTIPSYKIIYNDDIKADSDEFINISDALGTKFNYAELMGRI